MNETDIAKYLLDVIEGDILPLTEVGVRTGNKVFGAAALQNRICHWSLRAPIGKWKILCGMRRCRS